MLKQDAREIEKVPLSNSINQCIDDKSWWHGRGFPEYIHNFNFIRYGHIAFQMVVSSDTQFAIYKISYFSLVILLNNWVVWVSKFLIKERVKRYYVWNINFKLMKLSMFIKIV